MKAKRKLFLEALFLNAPFFDEANPTLFEVSPEDPEDDRYWVFSICEMVQGFLSEDYSIEHRRALSAALRAEADKIDLNTDLIASTSSR